MDVQGVAAASIACDIAKTEKVRRAQNRTAKVRSIVTEARALVRQLEFQLADVLVYSCSFGV